MVRVVIGNHIILLPQGLGKGTHDCGAQVGYGICTREEGSG